MSSEQPKLEWIPVPRPCLYLGPGAYWCLGRSGSKWVTTGGVRMDESVTHYCPIPKPVMPEPVPQDCPWCGSRVHAICAGDKHYTGCENTKCFAEGPRTDTKIEAITAWNRITLREVDND